MADKPNCLDPRWRCIVLYGPDRGLVRERSDAILRALIESEKQPKALEDAK